jgi:hypothetical protein
VNVVACLGSAWGNEHWMSGTYWNEMPSTADSACLMARSTDGLTVGGETFAADGGLVGAVDRVVPVAGRAAWGLAGAGV